MKIKGLLLIVPTILLSSCGSVKENLSVVESFLRNARKGFTLKGVNTLTTKNDLTGEVVFTTKTSYNHEYDNQNGSRVKLESNNKVGSDEEKEIYYYAKSEDGFLANEYINYKNEVSLMPLITGDGTYFLYDNLYYNPFELLEEEDLIKDEANENIYHLKEDKCTLFGSYLTLDNFGYIDVTFDFNDIKNVNIKLETVEFNGKTLLPDTNTYVKANWKYEYDFTLSNLALTTFNAVTPSEQSENKELKDQLSKINDNYTLVIKNIFKTTNEVMSYQTIFMGDEKVYLDLNNDLDNVYEDFLYQKDIFKEDDERLYEYRLSKDYNKWMTTFKEAPDSYNVNPQTLDKFIPDTKNIDVSLFKKENDKYVLNNEGAKGAIIDAFLPKTLDTGVSTSLIGTGAEITLGTEEINIHLPYSFEYSNTTYECSYELTFKNIGSTVLPVSL